MSASNPGLTAPSENLDVPQDRSDSVTGRPSRPRVDVLLAGEDLSRSLRDDAANGLRTPPRNLSPMWLYDDYGSMLFEQITQLPEYYPTRAELEILLTRASDIATVTAASTFVELGSGTSTKTRVLLRAFERTGRLHRYVPFDVAATTLHVATAKLTRRFPALEIHGIVGDFNRHLAAIPVVDDTTIALLGGTVGNLTPSERARLLDDIAAITNPGDHLLLGVDLVKDPRRIVRAYADSSGVTATFNRNVLTRLNRELSANFDVASFTHHAAWDFRREWIEMRLRATRAMQVTVRDLDLHLDIDAGEEIRTEISAKFRREGIEAELDRAGFRPTGWWTDIAADVAIVAGSRR